jgi:ABC-type multidrug transport system ATPase subunit
MIEINNLQVTFEKKTILKNFSMSVKKHEKAVIAGESGKGKTSLLHVILGFLPFKKGTIFINGKELNAKHIGEIRSLTAFVPQEIYMPDTSVKDMFYKPFLFKNNSAQKPDRDTIEKSFSLLGLESDLLQKNTDEISGGQKQRIAIASALMLNKPIVLLDEPTSALDENSIKKLIAFLNNQGDKTILATSHNKTWIENSDKVINLDLYGKNA